MNIIERLDAKQASKNRWAMSVRAEVRATYSYFIAFGLDVFFAFVLRVFITFPFVVYF